MELKEQQQAFLQDLLTTSAPVQVPVAPIGGAVTTERANKRPATHSKNSLYDQILESLAYVASLMIACGLWIAGAFFTLVFLHSTGLPIGILSWGQWIIPLLISAVELKLWPRRGRGPQRLVIWAAVLAFDVGTSWAGLVAWGAGRHINLFSGITLPTDGVSLSILALGLGLVFAFAPEKLGKWAVRELRTLWRI